jgi:hypothetical protein
MSTEPCDPASLAAARDARRWLIGVSISVVFGLFGMVMALLGHLQGSRPAAPAGVNIPAQSGREPASPRRDRRPGDRHR